MKHRQANGFGKATLFVVVTAFAAIGCGSDPGDSGPEQSVKLDNQAKIEGFLEGKALVMQGDDIPTYPNGYLQDVNFAAATQCYNRVDMLLTGSNFHVTSKLGLLEGAPNKGDTGTCDRSKVTTELSFDSTTYVIDNVQGDAQCFDITLTYMGFGQEGRGALNADRSALLLELFFKDQATGHRCASGPPGSGGVTLNGSAFSGDAVQTYRVN